MKRATADEQMDAPDLPAETYAAVLKDLAQVNRLTLAARPTLGFLRRALGDKGSFSLLDVGFGHGDMLRRIADLARRTGMDAELVGIDLNPRSELVARAATPPDMPIRYATGDYRFEALRPDFIISSLVAHHMSREQLVEFLRFMEARALKGWMVNDLHRHRLSFWGFPLLARIMGWHPIVRQDGQLSVARAFTASEWEELLEEAGISEARIVRRFPFRLCVERLR